MQVHSEKTVFSSIVQLLDLLERRFRGWICASEGEKLSVSFNSRPGAPFCVSNCTSWLTHPCTSSRQVQGLTHMIFLDFHKVKMNGVLSPCSLKELLNRSLEQQGFPWKRTECYFLTTSGVMEPWDGDNCGIVWIWTSEPTHTNCSQRCCKCLMWFGYVQTSCLQVTFSKSLWVWDILLCSLLRRGYELSWQRYQAAVYLILLSLCAPR